MKYVFSEEIFVAVSGKPKGKGVWVFGDRNKEILITVGSAENPLNYSKAKKAASAEFLRARFPMYKTIYLHS